MKPTNPTRNISSRIQDVVFAMMFLSWGFLRVIVVESPADRWTTAQLAPALLHFLASWQFFRRQPLCLEGRPIDIATAIPSFLIGGVMVSLAPASADWQMLAQFIFAIGAIGTAFSLLTLGRSFAIFPAFRSLVKKGPYRIIRHPAYFFEMVMLAGVAVAAADYRCWLLFPVGVSMFAMRIHFEERLLLQSSVYQTYSLEVRHRLIPHLW